MADRRKVDYSLYLVTDSTPAILGNRNICDVVEATLKGGVTIVQYRDKTSDTGHMITIGRQLHEITKRHNVPLLINDRVDVALAVGCEGVHIGQDDMEVTLARRLLGPEAIIGVTASTVEEAKKACQDGADYLGIGTVFATATKTNSKNIIGNAGLRDILFEIDETSVPTVCIGGINESNVQRVMYQSAGQKKALDGVAVVSAIMAAEDPEAAARRLLELVKSPPPFVQGKEERIADDSRKLVIEAANILKAVHESKPLSHNMTNLVVQNFAANVALAMGASPIMANYGEEAPDLCKLRGSLVINMGTVTPEGLKNYVQALKAYNAVGQPVVFDPVGAGATTVRLSAVKTIMESGYLDVIKGNEGEIMTIFSDLHRHPDMQRQQQRGVDSAASTLNDMSRAVIVASLARRERTVAVATGEKDFVSDGVRTVHVANGHPWLGVVTGTGCALGTAISAALAARPEDKFAATVAAMLHFEIAAELAAERPDVKGPGSFVPAFLDELYAIRMATARGEVGWLERAKIEMYNFSL